MEQKKAAIDFLRSKQTEKFASLKKTGQVQVRVDQDLVEPFCNMASDADVNLNQAINRCIEKCLREAGYLK